MVPTALYGAHTNSLAISILLSFFSRSPPFMVLKASGYLECKLIYFQDLYMWECVARVLDRQQSSRVCVRKSVPRATRMPMHNIYWSTHFARYCLNLVSDRPAISCVRFKRELRLPVDCISNRNECTNIDNTSRHEKEYKKKLKC